MKPTQVGRARRARPSRRARARPALDPDPPSSLFFLFFCARALVALRGSFRASLSSAAIAAREGGGRDGGPHRTRRGDRRKTGRSEKALTGLGRGGSGHEPCAPRARVRGRALAGGRSAAGAGRGPARDANSRGSAGTARTLAAASRAAAQQGGGGDPWHGYSDKEKGDESRWIRQQEAERLRSSCASSGRASPKAPAGVEALVEAERTALAKLLMEHQVALPHKTVAALLDWKHHKYD